MKVIVRDFYGKPLKRIAMESIKSLIYIRNPDAEYADVKSVGFPSADVFLFDEHLYARLIAEWEAGGRTKDATWCMAKRYNEIRYKSVK